jgi:S-adenosylmethionine synthetase
MSKFKTAESVTEGHPDKLCDLIADSILDETLKLDPDCHVACEVMATKGNVIVAGEISTKKLPHIENIVIDTLFRVGYDAFEYEITNLIHSQSKDIEQAVNGEELGAGDQGIVYGYADNDTSQYLPLPVVLAHKLTNRLTECFQSGEIPYLKPDGKSQVTVEYDENDIPIRVTSVIVSAQHDGGIPHAKIHYDIISKVVIPTIPKCLIDHNTKSLINPSGRFVEGGPSADTGLTGRKLMVDSYGGLARFGGGAFSGKDPTKVDRSGAYFARYVAKNIVAAGLADKCEIAVSYAIGKAEPTSISVDTFGTGAICDNCILKIITKLFDFRPSAIIKKLDLKKPIYSETSVGGHFGRAEFSWEKLDMVENILEEVTNGI